MEASVVDAPCENCWSAVQVLALARFNWASTLPVVGEIVSVVLAAATEVTAPLHTPLREKQPAVRLMPLAAVEVAVALVMFKRLAASPPVKVEVEVTAPVTFKKPCKVEVPVVLPWMVEVAVLPTYRVV